MFTETLLKPTMLKKTRKRPTIASIDLENLAFNYRSVSSFIGDDTDIMAVIKADAYGHGSVECAKRLEAEGVKWFGVALPEEGIELRDAGIGSPILCMGGFWPGQETAIVESGLTSVIFSLEHAKLLDTAASRKRSQINYHVKIDTGMGRLGIRYDQVQEFVVRLKEFSHIKLDGVMTHFAAADDLSENEFTKLQASRFDEVVGVFIGNGYQPSYLDLANSPGAIAHPDCRRNLVRLGGVLYGLGGDVLPHSIQTPQLRPVMSISSRISQLSTVRTGETLGYGRTFTTSKDSVIAMVPIGYADGYPRSLSNSVEVIVNDHLAPVVGRISMDWTIIDVSKVPDVHINDEVVLLGSTSSHAVRAEDLAAISGTIAYEITCGISTRIPRVYS